MRRTVPLLERLRVKVHAPRLSAEMLAALPEERRFLDFDFDPSVCWIWTGAFSTGKRGSDRPQIQLGGRGSPVVHVCRVMLSFKDGIPLDERGSEMTAAHSCHHPPCINPFHLDWELKGSNATEGSRARAAWRRSLREITAQELRERCGSLV